MDIKLLTAQELATALNLSVETIWRYTRENTIPTIKLGKRQYRYDQDAVLRALGSEVREEKPSYAHQEKITYDEYAKLPIEPGYSYELINGVLIKEPSPVIHHQRVSRRLHRILEDHFSNGEVFSAPLDVVFSEYTVVQPDLIYLPNLEYLKSTKYIGSTPLLVVEILSHSSVRRDRIEKLNLYRQSGVIHYWILDPHNGMIEAYKLVNKNYVQITATDSLSEHPDFPTLSFDLKKLCHNPQKKHSK